MFGMTSNGRRRRHFGMLLSACLALGLAANFGITTALAQDRDRITGEALRAVLEARTVKGKYLEDGKWYHFKETYKADGTLSGKGGPNSNPTKWSWTGTWKITGDQACFDYPEYDDKYCLDLYRVGDKYEGERGGKVTEWHKVIK